MREMIDSRDSWIGLIPKTWKTKRIKEFLVERKETCTSNDNYDLLAVSEYYGVARKTDVISDNEFITHAESLEGYKVCHPDDLVMNIMLAWKRAMGVSNYSGITSPAYCVFSPKEEISMQYFHHLFRTDLYASLFKQYSTGIIDSRLRLYPDKFLALRCHFPSVEEQQRIADFLDHKCTDIDSVLEKTKTSIDEYKKLKQAVITKAITKGIRGERPIKESGSTWFGQIPSTWEANKLKYTFTIRKRIVGEDGHTVLAITQKGVKPKDMSNGNGQFAESYANYQIVHPGDFAMNHMDLLTGWVDISKYEGVTSPDYRVFTLNDATRNCPGYYLYMMQMCYTNRIFYSMGQGVSGMGRWRLPADMFNNFIIACPPLEEQQEIAAYLDKKCSELDFLIASKEKFITELESYKKSLIFECVTGKKEV